MADCQLSTERINLKRLFTFGCSFTQYQWPTWADILGREFDFFENWGRSGGGNHFVFNSLNECVIRNKLEKNDTVVIMWTNIYREDRYAKNQWITLGNIYGQSQEFLDKNFVKYSDYRGYLIRDLAFIHASKKILDQIGVKYIFLSMVPISYIDQYNKVEATNVADVISLYKETIDFIRPSIYETIFNCDWTSKPFSSNKLFDSWILDDQIKNIYDTHRGTDWPLYEDYVLKRFSTIPISILNEIDQKINKLYTRIDLHPTPIEHLEYLDLVLLEIPISENTRNWTKEIDKNVRLNIDLDTIWKKNIRSPNRL